MESIVNLTKIDISELERQNPAVAKTLENVLYRTFKLGAVEGAQRLAFVGKQFKRLTVEEAYHFIDPDEILREVEEVQARKKKVGVWQVVRNISGIAPLVFTWLSLFFAAKNYQQDLANPKYNSDQYQPFLRLWQEGFHGAFGLTFSQAAFTDVMLLFIYISFILLVPIIERRARNEANKFFTELQIITDEMLDVVGVAGVNPITSDADIDKIVKALTRVIDRAVLSSNNVAQQAKDFIIDAEARVNTLLSHFDTDLATFNSDVQILTTDLTNLGNDLRGHNQQVKDLTDASTKLAGASSSLTVSAQEMANSATTSATASTTIGSQLSSLNTTQQEIIKAQQEVVKEIADSQKDVVKEIASAADNMDVVAKDTKLVAKELGQITKADLQAMTDKVADAADEVTRFANGLSQINAQLKSTAGDLQSAANNLANASSKRRQQPQPPQQHQQPFNLPPQQPPQQFNLPPQQSQQPFNLPPQPQQSPPQQPPKSLLQRFRNRLGI
jgi:hypothetical protein